MSTMKKKLLILCYILVGISSICSANEASPIQILFTIKKIFPDIKEVSFFLIEDTYKDLKPKIERASIQSQITSKIYLIQDKLGIGQNIKNLEENSTLIILNSELYTENSTKLFILSKCKEKKINIITTINDYIESGALIGLILENNQVKIILNLKQNGHLKEKFTPEIIQQLGITMVIE
jgi:ABC-type uncharacterized transport system substrate-binding protein